MDDLNLEKKRFACTRSKFRKGQMTILATARHRVCGYIYVCMYIYILYYIYYIYIPSMFSWYSYAWQLLWIVDSAQAGYRHSHCCLNHRVCWLNPKFVLVKLPCCLLKPYVWFINLVKSQLVLIKSSYFLPKLPKPQFWWLRWSGHPGCFEMLISDCEMP